MSEQSGDRPRHICTGCKKVIDCRQPPTACHDCGGYYRPATAEDVACDRCDDPDGHRLLDRTGKFDRLCDGCIEDLGLRDGQPVPDGGVPECRFLGCDVRQEFPEATDEFCIHHSMSMFFVWQHLAEFGPINPRWSA